MSRLTTFRRILYRPLALALLGLGLGLGLAALLSSCGNGNAAPTRATPAASNADVKMAPLAGMPVDVKSAPATVQQAYEFAVANPDVLKQIPCYCGCGAMGHTSNYACYVAGKNADGTLKFESHALGCSTCVDIALDTMRLLKAGKTVKEIRAYVDNKYSQYGPSNMP
jgi:Protein of unknown function with PCYCGC motif